MRADWKVIGVRFLPLAVIVFVFTCGSCSKQDYGSIMTDTTKHSNIDTTPFVIDNVSDTYAALAPISLHAKWGPYNVHDPSIKKLGDYYYCYSTDVAFGADAPPGIQVRRSKDLVDWRFVGWVFSSAPKLTTNFIKDHGGTPYNGYWAPYVMQVGSEYRLYYSLSSPTPTPRLSAIGLLTSSSPEGPWTEKGLVVTSLNDNSIQTNAIDPTVVVDKNGSHWFFYGSAWDGIYIIKLNASTGLPAVSGDKGKRIAQRGFTAGKINGNIEGADVIYNATLDKFYMFIAYDWLSTKYNTRVVRADNPDGPYYDYNGHDANLAEDHGPMITAPYKFNNQSGWQGVSHVTVFKDDDEQYYIAHQGRPAINSYYMDLHVRKLFWTDDGWPIASPERYAATRQQSVTSDSLVGQWERIQLNYSVVPGYSAEQTSPDFQLSQSLSLNQDGSINATEGTWSYDTPWLNIQWNGGTGEKLLVEWGRDWEHKQDSVLIFTGLNNNGTAIWGKKVIK